MHKLDRDGAKTPSCLCAFNYQTQSWDDLTSSCKREVRSSLVNMQRNPSLAADASEYGVLCAYCEGAVYTDRHLEHFRRKNPKYFPKLTFEWSNLFLACGSSQHCGHYKDRKSAPSYNPDDLIKPDEMDPEDYLYFHSSGEVRARAGIAPTEEVKAQTTIQVFGLNNPSLCGLRYKSLQKYKEIILEDLHEIESWSAEERNTYLQGEVEATRWEPYATTIKHFLTKQ